MIDLGQLKTPFRWYLNAAKAVKGDKTCKGDFKYKLITPKDRLLPFMFRYPAPTGSYFPVHWKIYYSSDDSIAFDLDALIPTSLQLFGYDGYHYMIYTGAGLEGMELGADFYYSTIELEDGTILTSEDFWIDCELTGNTVTGGDFNIDYNNDFGPAESFSSLEKYVKLIWWNTCDLGNILYQTGYQNFLYLDAAIVREPGQIQEEGSEDGNKDFVTEYVKYIDMVSIKDLLPEYVFSALQSLPIHSNCVVVANDLNYIGLAKRSELSFEYQTPCLATTTLKFQLESALMRGACCGNNQIVNLLACNAIIGGITVVVNGTGFNGPIVTVQEGSPFQLQWPLVSGAPDEYEVYAPFISAGVPQSVATTVYDIASAPSGSYTITVKPKCTIGGVVSYGNTVAVTVVVP